MAQDFAKEIEQLAELKKKGLITEEEFNAKKAQILAEPPKAQKVPKQPEQVMCSACGRYIPADAKSCQYCGFSTGPKGPVKPTMKPILGGILIMLGGFAAIGWGITYFYDAALWEDLPYVGSALSYWLCGALEILFGIIAIPGGFYAIRRERFELATFGGIASIAGFFFLGLVGLILVSMSKDEFKKE